MSAYENRLSALAATPLAHTIQIPQVKKVIALITTAIIPTTIPAVATPVGMPSARAFFPALTASTKPTIDTGRATKEKKPLKKPSTRPTMLKTNPAAAMMIPFHSFITKSLLYVPFINDGSKSAF